MAKHSADDRAQVLQDATAQFWKHTTPIVLMGLVIHVILLVLFVMLEMPLLWAANVLSVLSYLVCLHAIRIQRFRLVGLLMSGEIIFHAVLATWMLGWESNFHFYVYCLVPVIAFSFQKALGTRLCLSLGVVAVEVGGFILRHKMGIASGVAPELLETFGILNLLTATTVLLYATALSVRFSFSMQLNLYHTAHRDSLTNLYTRRRILQRVRQLDSQPAGLNAAIVLLDIDHFKQLNDRHGHDIGDIVLQRIAQSISSCVRGTDMAARWGGEEFLVLMPNTPLADAQAVAERIQAHIREEAGRLTEGRVDVTATVAVTIVEAGEAFRDAFIRADQLLYLGKQQGRNRVMLAS